MITADIIHMVDRELAGGHSLFFFFFFETLILDGRKLEILCTTDMT